MHGASCIRKAHLLNLLALQGTSPGPAGLMRQFGSWLPLSTPCQTFTPRPPAQACHSQLATCLKKAHSLASGCAEATGILCVFLQDHYNARSGHASDNRECKCFMAAALPHLHD